MSSKWKDDKPYGKGTHITINGNKYNFELGAEEGTFSSIDGEYSGGYIMGKNGETSTIITPEGKYSGENKNYKKHGQGTFTYNNNDIYNGEWKDGKRDGQGTFIYINGNKYEGEWKNDNRDGQGTLT
mmetsp:Transcript_18579/g.15206  ORF Transcript_18579/g.15206 Transcript_18579/m.15206 type:complete len:127 (+) Transcript_18579:419-799(+)